MPILQLGTAQLVTLPNVRDDLPPNFTGFLPEQVHRQLELALQSGVRAFDTAAIYRSHRPMGRVLGEWWRTGQLTSRREIWITSKVFHPFSSVGYRRTHMPDLSDLTPGQVDLEVNRCFEESLDDLGIGYVDLMLLHWPSEPHRGDAAQNRRRRLAAWQALEDLYEKGWARAIGVSNFSPVHLDQLQEDGARITPMVNQIEASVTLQYPNILDYCLRHNIVVQAYSPLGRGYKELPHLVSELAQKHGKDVGQICFRYLWQLGYRSITYLTNAKSRMVTNTHIFDFELSDKEMMELNRLNRPDGGWGLPDPNTLE